MASSQRFSATPVSSLSRWAAAGSVVGRRRTRRAGASARSDSSTVRPKVDSTQLASGSAASSARSRCGPPASAASMPRTSSPGEGSRSAVARRSVSPMTRSGLTRVPNSRVATSATACCASVNVAADAIVADVPMHCRLWEAQASRSRRTSSATSAPWRPR